MNLEKIERSLVSAEFEEPRHEHFFLLFAASLNELDFYRTGNPAALMGCSSFTSGECSQYLCLTCRACGGVSCVSLAGDSLSCTSPQILNFFVMTKTLGVLMRQHTTTQTLTNLSDHRRNAE